MKILFIGGTKFIGKELAKTFVNQGHRVTIFSRSSVRVEGCEHVLGDREKPGDLRKLATNLSGKQFDIVYDMCAYNEDHARSLYETIRSSFKHLVVFSTAAVYAKTNHFPLSELSELGDHPSFGDYGTKKAQVEGIYIQASSADKFKLTIFRPHYILGIGDYFQRHEYLLHRITNSNALYLPGNGQALIQFVWYEDVVNAFLQIPRLQKGRIEIVNLSSNEMFSLLGLVEYFANGVDIAPEIVNADYRSAGLDESRFYDDLFIFPNLNLILDSQKARNTYGINFKNIESIIPVLLEDWNIKKNEYKPNTGAELLFGNKI